MADKGCKEITKDYELVVVECDGCGFHLGVDATYLEQVGAVAMDCPSCGLGWHIGDEPDASEASPEVQRAFINRKGKK